MNEKDSYFDDLINNEYEDMKKPFTQVFRVNSTELGQQVIPLMKTKILDKLLTPGQAFLVESVSLNGKPISEFYDKILVGKLHTDSGVFNIIGHLNTPSED